MLKLIFLFTIIFNNFLYSMDLESNNQDYNFNTNAEFNDEDEYVSQDSDIDLDYEVPKIGKLEELKAFYLFGLNAIQPDLESIQPDENLELNEKTDIETKPKTKDIRQYKGIFKCPKCKKIFKRCDGLSAHKITHTNQKPFKCPPCGKSYTNKSALYKHNKRHHQ